MELAEVAPFNKLLGLKVHQRSPERSEAELTVREERRGVLHGGAVMALGACPSNSGFCWSEKRESDSLPPHEQDIPRLEDR